MSLNKSVVKRQVFGELLECPVCGATFESHHPTHTYCGDKCRNRARRNINDIERACLHCGETFTTTSSSNRFHCAADCYYQSYEDRHLLTESRRAILCYIAQHKDTWLPYRNMSKYYLNAMVNRIMPMLYCMTIDGVPHYRITDYGLEILKAVYENAERLDVSNG